MEVRFYHHPKLHWKQGVFEQNNERAQELRNKLQEDKTLLINLMSSPGSGKTTTLVATINALKEDLKIGVMEADIDSDVDAKTIDQTGLRWSSYTLVACVI